LSPLLGKSAMFKSNLALKALADWNKRVLTEWDALEFCRLNNIRIVEDPIRMFGSIEFYKGYVFIIINPGLRKAMRLWVLWHEIGHFILHDAQEGEFSTSIHSKVEAEANFVAAIALMPRPMVEGKSMKEIYSETGYRHELIEIRHAIMEGYGV
jgi:Zn-dependent peptidase ImmA (M78 family)